MADLSIFTGRQNIGDIPNVLYGNESFKDIFGEIIASNSQAVQFTNEINAVLAPMEVEVPRKNNSPLPVKVHNVKFAEGGVQTSAKEFRPYMDKFDMTKSQGKNVMVVQFDDETILEARNNKVDLDMQVLENIREIRGVYVNKYLAFSRLKAVITGTTLSDTIPTLDSGTTGLAGYKRAFGFARGEDYSDFLTTADGVTTRNHYRTIKGSTWTTTDITDAIDLVINTNVYSGQGVIVLGNPRTVQAVASLANAPENKDIEIFGRVTSALGADWKQVNGMHPDFLIFLDKGYLNGSSPLLVRGVEVDEAQRGLGMMYKNDLKAFKSIVDMNGAKFRIFPEEWYMTYRLSGVILDTKAGRGHASGTMQADSVTALENWVAVLNSYWKA